MGSAKTLLSIFNVPSIPQPLSESALIIVDAQREYVDGGLPLYKIDSALQQLKELLERARKLKTPIFHVVHHAPAGAPVFNPDSEFVQIAEVVRPTGDEPVITKHHPNSFVDTTLKDFLDKCQRNNLVIAGFMTHMCISATARGAFDLGYSSTVVASACTTRDLPGLGGEVISAQDVHASNLAALADMVSIVASTPSDIPD